MCLGFGTAHNTNLIFKYSTKYSTGSISLEEVVSMSAHLVRWFDSLHVQTVCVDSPALSGVVTVTEDVNHTHFVTPVKIFTYMVC